MRTRVSELLDIEFPILAFSHCRDVVAAVSNAGGMGVLGAVAHSPEQLKIDLDWIEAETGGKPYGVDLLVPPKYVGSDVGGMDRKSLADLLPAEHKAFVDEMLERYGVPPLPEGGKRSVQTVAIGGMRIDPKSMAPLLDVAFEHRIGLVASALGPPPEEMIDGARSNDVVVAALAGAPEHARRHKEAGVDLIVAQGTEAGGHTGEISTMVLVPEIVDAVAPTPVLAAGGIGRGRQIAASFALGAEGVWCGSVWLTTEEAETAPAVKEKFLHASLRDTVRSRSLTGKPARMLKTAWTDEWDRPDTPDPLPMPLQPMLIGDAQMRINRSANTPGTGANQLVNYFVGQIVGSEAMHKSKPAGRVVLEMVEELVDALERLERLTAED